MVPGGGQAVSISATMESLVGRALIGIRRMRYIVHEEVYSDRGPLELTFEGALPLVFDTAGNGQDLRVKRGAWRDPFAEPLSQENRDWVAKAGKWQAFDVSAEWPFSALIGRPLSAVRATAGPSAAPEIGGLVLTIGVDLLIEVGADELEVEVLIDSPASPESSSN